MIAARQPLPPDLSALAESGLSDVERREAIIRAWAMQSIDVMLVHDLCLFMLGRGEAALVRA